MNIRLRTLLSLLICTLLLAGCGQTGRLYLPETDTAAGTTSPQEEPPATDDKPAAAPE